MLDKNISTYKELAKLLKISPTQLSNILSDEYNPIKSNIQEIADFFEIDPLDILRQ